MTALDASTFSVSTLDASVNNAGKLRYDALEPKGRRKSPTYQIVREDNGLFGNKRTKLASNSADVMRNFAVAAWAMRRHLDYVSRFDFQAQNADQGLNAEIERLITNLSRPYNFDAGGRFGREKGFRIAEARRVIDNDTFLLLLSNGQIQGIEGDLVRDPPKVKQAKGTEWVEGVRINNAGKALAYALHRRKKGSGHKYVKTVPARNIIHYGFFERWASEQVRGVSPLVASLNNFRDVYEGIDYALIKAKLSQIFAVALTRGGDLGLDSESGLAGSDTDDVEDDLPPREVDLTGGPSILDFTDDGISKAEVLESRTPSMELQQFSRLVLMIALKSLDIPYVFFDEAHTNYAGQRGSWLHYERACLDRRDDQIEMRRRWTVFQLQRLILNGELQLPSGMSIGDLQWQWIPKGMPWWKPSEELTADLMAISAGLTSIPKVCAKNDLGDPLENIRQNAEIMRAAEEAGITLSFGGKELFQKVAEEIEPPEPPEDDNEEPEQEGEDDAQA